VYRVGVTAMGLTFASRCSNPPSDADPGHAGPGHAGPGHAGRCALGDTPVRPSMGPTVGPAGRTRTYLKR